MAPEFLDWLGLPAGLRRLDVGRGTGAVTAAILERGSPSEVVCVDPWEGYVAYAAEHLSRGGVADATHLPPGSFDAVVSALVLNFVRDPGEALRAMREAAPGGTVAAYVWDYAGRMELMRYFWDAAVELDPGARDLDVGVRFSICRPERLERAWQEAGFADVASPAVNVPTIFRDFDDFRSTA